MQADRKEEKIAACIHIDNTNNIGACGTSGHGNMAVLITQRQENMLCQVSR